jgi:hypothetical protein
MFLLLRDVIVVVTKCLMRHLPATGGVFDDAAWRVQLLRVRAAEVTSRHVTFTELLPSNGYVYRAVPTQPPSLLASQFRLSVDLLKYKGRCLIMTVTGLPLLSSNDRLLCLLVVTVNVLCSVHPDEFGRCPKLTILSLRLRGGRRRRGRYVALPSQSAYNERRNPPLVGEETPLPSSDTDTGRRSHKPTWRK